MTGILCSMVGAKPQAAAATNPTGGIRFERSNLERVAVTSWGNKPADNKIQVCSFWFKFNTLPSSAATFYIPLAGQYSDNNLAIGPFFDASNRFNMYTHFGSGFNQTIYTPSPALATGNWYHIVAKNNGTNSGRTQVWFNGTRVIDQAAANNGSNFGYAAFSSYNIAAATPSAPTWHFDGCLEQIYWYAGDIDLDTNISKFYNNGWVDMGTAGTTSGLPTPHIYHWGNTQSDFILRRGSTTGTATVTGTISACV